MYEGRNMEINSLQRNLKKGREGHDPITFTAEDSDGIDAKPNDAIVVGVQIAHRDVLRVMINNRSSTDILSARVYDELRLDRKDLEPFHVPLKGFGGTEVSSLGIVKLPVRFGTAPCREKEEPSESIVLDETELDKTVKIGARLAEQVKRDVSNLLIEYKEIFAWSHEDMPGISRSVISHNLAIDEKSKPVVQKRRSFNPERSTAIKEEISKLLAARSIREVKYPEWVANVVLVKKKNNQWRMCVDFTDLNKACPKDSFLLPRIDQLVDATAGHETLSFMDAYSGYNQIKMHKPDEEKTSFTTDQGLYCYTVMPFGLKNAGVTYQRLINKMFAKQIGKNMEVYVDDLLTKSVTVDKHVDDLRETFDVLTRYGMKLNPTKCVFSVQSERFIVKSTDRCLPFFKALKKGKGVEWNEDCEKAFQALKEYLGRAPLLSKPVTEEILYMYLSVFEAATSYVLKPEVSGRLTKWAIELSEFDVEYLPRTAIKGQAVADFVAEFTEPNMEVARMMVEQTKKTFRWQLRVDRSSNTHGSGAGVVVSTPERDSVECALRFEFKATNNQAEYEALIAGLRVCTVLGADEVEIFSNSQVIINQVLDEYQERDEKMIAYLKLAKELLGRFKEYRIIQIPREENEQADALAKLASATINIWPRTIPMIHLLQPILNGELYKKGYSRALQRCVGLEEAEGILRSIHSGNCGNHVGGVSLAHKTLRQGFYWPTLFADAKRVAARCEACQKIANNIRQPPELLQSITSPWPFAMWGIDLIGPMPTAPEGAKHAIVAVDYFTKWVEAESLVHITEENTTSFVKKNILYRFGMPNTIITNNGTQFDSKKFRELCDKYGINNYYATPAHPQTNGQTEAVNKIIKHNLKAKLAAKKG
ncbi:hypothetical protein LWI29_027080 [Acer saccharum]|uniref:Uncharacterized protein n=1 Tax=Acer saccharum TaxID=4024 RepID=A0AA39VPC8_ACESA|nr:hypothetical protein LWI29_027080 [Acer saccharum]